MARPKKKREAPKRFNLVMSQELHSKVESLRDQLEADSITELLRRSLAVYIFLWEAKKDGGELVLKEKDGTEKSFILL